MKVSDEVIISALLSTGTNKDAAKKCGLSEKQLYNRMGRPCFQSKLATARSRLLEGAIAALSSRMGVAIYTMNKLMLSENTPPGVRLSAAESILRNGLKLAERGDILDRLDKLEQMLEEER